MRNNWSFFRGWSTNRRKMLPFSLKFMLPLQSMWPPMMLLLFLVFAYGPVNSQLINEPPAFIAGSGDMSRFSLLENTPVGSPVYQLKGQDPENSRLKYSISGPVFSVDRETGVVRLRQELDRESQDTIEVIISLTDEGIYGTEPNTVSLRRVIPVRDYNDNPPAFIGRPYAVSISEASPLGTELDVLPNGIQIIDRDQGVNAEIQVKCVQENDLCETFDVRTEQIAEGNYSARIYLRNLLDFESRPTYIMTLSASDGAVENRLTSFATVSISVIDVQDQPPVFTNAPYSATLRENTAPDTEVIRIKASDGDFGIPRDIVLSLENEVFGHFKLESFGDPKDGNAVLKTTNVSLDRENPAILENGGVYVFSIRATELTESGMPDDSSVTQVTIVVTDIDDHDPEFNENFFNVSIPENLGKGMALPGLTIFVDDLDMAENSQYELSLRDVWNSEGVFSISPTQAQGRTPVVVRISDPTKLDFDVDDENKRRFMFEILASAQGRTKSKTQVQVNLLDSNDNSPIFEKKSYQFSIEEDAPIDTLIGEVKANDKDSGEFGLITYVLKGFGSNYFDVDSSTGAVFVKKPLDFEKQSSFSLSVKAVDGGGQEGNANLYIDIIDVNDNSPRFESSEYSRTIREGAANFEPQFFVKAFDDDGPSQGGGRIKYEIVSENSISGNVFRIDENTGEISLQKTARSMDTQRGEYELIVSATDYGVPPLTNTTKVSIRVGISGNQRPIFRGHFQNIENVPVLGPPSYRVSIPENAQPGFNVTTVTAHDPDGLDSQLRYRIVGANDNFRIDEISGLITVSPHANIDRDSNMDSFEITVNAVDSGTPIPETATTTVYVNIKDVNDESPKFEQASYAAYVSERTDIGENVLRIRAKDKDLNSKLFYSLKGLVKATTKAGISISSRSNYKAEEAFDINSETGDIYVNSSLNHDVAAIIILQAEVRDLNAEVNPENQTDLTEVTIYVQSFKDTNPVFLNKGWSSNKPVVNIKIQEEMPIDSALFILMGEDPVTKEPIRKFRLIEPLELEFFHLNEESGEVTLQKRLDYEALTAATTQIEFQVEAFSADLSRSTISKVNITVENVNDNEPYFEESEYQASIVENKVYPEKVLTVQAKDRDAVFNARDERLGYHKITYSLHGEYAYLFEINNRTGEIVIAPNATIDREKTPLLHLQVKAEDSPGRRTEAKQSIVDLHINVLDVNDNAPQFSMDNSYTAVIPENAPIDSLVLKVQATDLDEGPGGEIRYEIFNEGEVKGLFKINPETGEIKTKRFLTGKGRAVPYSLTLRAEDNGSQVQKQVSLFSDVSVTIFIGDISSNDGIPSIISPQVGQMANITENSPVGSAVFQVIAMDPDSPNTPSGMLSYRILDDTPDSSAFAIDEMSGLITTMTSLDREEKSMYNIILEVSDNGQPRQAVTRILQIMVLDVDDHRPLFVREINAGPMVYSVLEEEPNGTFVGTFTALDEDIGDNASIDYVIINGNHDNFFRIERTNTSLAMLRTNKPIDREQYESFTLTVKCLKYGESGLAFIGNEYSRSDLSEAQITIKIVDIDDNLPEFEPKGASIGIRINVPIDTVITTIKATDRDAEAPPIHLSIANITFVPQFYKRSHKINTSNLNTLFTLNNRTGELRTGGSFADYVDGYFQMQIMANNSIKPKHHTNEQLKIFVIRDKSLLKFIFARPPSETQTLIHGFQQKMQSKLKPLGMELHLLDTQVLARADASLDFTATSSCFQMFKNGVAIPLQEMKKLMNSDKLKQELLDIYVEYGVSEVDSCSVRKAVAGVSMIASAGVWLVILAGLIGLGALVATCSAFCLKRKYKKHSKRSIQSSRTLTEPYSIDVPAVLYSEPIYGPL